MNILKTLIAQSTICIYKKCIFIKNTMSVVNLAISYRQPQEVPNILSQLQHLPLRRNTGVFK